jgi:serine/threonine protein kinase
VLSEDQLRKWYAQLVLGLQYLHSNQIMHRDLKSSNVFLTAQGDIQIGDFGLAKVRCPKTQRTTPCAVPSPVRGDAAVRCRLQQLTPSLSIAHPQHHFVGTHPLTRS